MTTDGPHTAALENRITEFGPAVLFIDTVAASFQWVEGNDSGNEGMGAVVGFARDLIAAHHDLAVVLVHHVPKGDAERPARTWDTTRMTYRRCAVPVAVGRQDHSGVDDKEPQRAIRRRPVFSYPRRDTFWHRRGRGRHRGAGLRANRRCADCKASTATRLAWAQSMPF